MREQHFVTADAAAQPGEVPAVNPRSWTGAPAFLENDIGGTVLPRLTAGELREIGVASVGHRRRIMEAIAALRGAPAVDAAAPPTAPEAERRQVTVMFSDLVGSTALSARLDPEDLREVIGRYHACVAETVGRHDGFLAK